MVDLETAKTMSFKDLAAEIRAALELLREGSVERSEPVLIHVASLIEILDQLRHEVAEEERRKLFMRESEPRPERPLPPKVPSTTDPRAYRRQMKDFRAKQLSYDVMLASWRRTEEAHEVTLARQRTELRRQVALDERIALNLRTEFDRPTSTARRLPWNFLPPPLDHTLDVWFRARRFSESSSPAWDQILFVLSLDPEAVFEGQDAFDGYLAFVFCGGRRAVLETPERDHAIYVFEDNWKELSRLPRSELLVAHRAELERVVHAGDWTGRLRSLVERSTSAPGR